MIELIAEPRIMKTWDSFVKENPPFSIALDGYVSGAPKYQPEGPRLNLNHHEGVDRLSTFSTCMQAYTRLRMGLFDRFSSGGEPHALIYVNDPDQDSALAAFVLTNPEIVLDNSNQKKLEELLHYEQMMDISSGMFSFDVDSQIMKNMAWIFEPYDSARYSGKIPKLNATETCEIIRDISFRVKRHLVGESGEVTLDTSYTVLDRRNSFAMVSEKSAYSRMRMVRDGIKSFISVRPRAEIGIYTYTLGRVSDFIPFDLSKIYDMLNEAERIWTNNPDRWGGSNTNGGSPKIRGSSISPNVLFKMLLPYTPQN